MKNECGFPVACFEPLEARTLLSGTITTLLSNGNLSILGDADANNISIIKVNNTVTITANDGEAFAGVGAEISGVTGNIRIVMGNGDDNVTIGQQGQSFWVGNDTAPNGFGLRADPADLTVDLGFGDDTLTMIGVHARNGTILGGAGLNEISISDNGGDIQLRDASIFYGNLSITNGNNGYDIVLAGTTVVRDTTIRLGNGGGVLSITAGTRLVDDEPAPLFGSNFLGNVTITGGTGDDDVTLTGTTADGVIVPLSIEGNLTVNLLGTTAAGVNTLRLTDTQVGGNLVYTGGAGTDVVMVQGSLLVGGNATLNMGAGENLFDASMNHQETVVRGNLIYTGGVGVDRLLSNGLIEVGNNATLNLGGGNNVISFTAGADEALAVGGNLLIRANGGDDQVTFTGGQGVAVGGNATIALAGGANMLSVLDGSGMSVMGNLLYTGGIGIDTIIIEELLSVARNATFTLGAGNNVLSITRDDTDETLLAVGGNLVVGALGGDDRVTLSGGQSVTVGGNTTFNLGAGDNNLSLLGVTNGMSTLGFLAYIGGVGVDTLIFEQALSVAGNATFTLGAGNNVFSITRGNTDAELLRVGGNLLINALGGTDEVTFTGGEQLVIVGNATFNLGAGDNTVSVLDSASGMSVARNFLYTGSVGIDRLLFNRPLEVGGAATLNLGGGNNVAQFSSTLDESLSVGGNLIIRANGGDDQVTFNGGEGVAVVGDTTIALGAGDNTLSVLNSSGMAVMGSLLYTGGIGVDTIIIQEFLGVGRNATFNLGAGNNVFSVATVVDDDDDNGNGDGDGDGNGDIIGGDDDLVELFQIAQFNQPGELMFIGGNLLINALGGNDQVVFNGGESINVVGNATFNLAAGDNELSILNSTEGMNVLGNLVYTGGVGVDTVVITEPLRVSNNATFNLGAGDNVLSVTRDDAEAELMFVGGNLLVTALGGDDRVTFSDGDGTEVRGNATFNLGAGDNVLLLNAPGGFKVVGNMAYTGGAGSDELRVVDSNLDVRGNLLVNAGAGNNTLSFVNPGNEVLSVGGNMTYTGGADNDTLFFNGGSSIIGNVQVRNGNGGNAMTTTSPFAVSGAFTYDGGSGVDRLELRSASIMGDTTIRTQAGDDVVAIFDNSMLRRVTVDSGAGNDRLFFGDDAAQTGGWDPTFISGPMTVNAGAGDDTLTLGYEADDPTLVVLGEPVRLNGGTGNDTLVIEDVLFAFTPLVLNW